MKQQGFRRIQSQTLSQLEHHLCKIYLVWHQMACYNQSDERLVHRILRLSDRTLTNVLVIINIPAIGKSTVNKPNLIWTLQHDKLARNIDYSWRNDIIDLVHNSLQVWYSEYLNNSNDVQGRELRMICSLIWKTM